MKIILSRKGFDSSNGKCPSPIMPDGTLLSMPIPSGDNDSYNDLHYNGIRYSDILKQLNPKSEYDKCHVDPDIRIGVRRKAVPDWKPAFGQIGAAQGVLANSGVSKGDIFLFFGWFHQTEIADGKYCFVRRKNADFYKCSDLQVIYGYMEVGEIITEKAEIAKYSWHPHSSYKRISDKTNALYIPAEKLSIDTSLSGFGIFDFREDRVLTMKGQTRAVWNNYEFLMPDRVYGNKKNSAKGDGLYYSGIWQELVVNESEELIDWVKSIIA